MKAGQRKEAKSSSSDKALGRFCGTCSDQSTQVKSPTQQDQDHRFTMLPTDASEPEDVSIVVRLLYEDTSVGRSANVLSDSKKA